MLSALSGGLATRETRTRASGAAGVRAGLAPRRERPPRSRRPRREGWEGRGMCVVAPAS